MAQLLFFIALGLHSIFTHASPTGFVPRHNIPANRAIPSGFVRASELAHEDSQQAQGSIWPEGQVVAQDVGSVGLAAQREQAPKDPFVPAKPMPPSRTDPSQDKIQALIESQSRLPSRSAAVIQPVQEQGPLGPAPINPALLQPQGPPQPQIIYVPVPVAQPAPAPTSPPPANLPSWMLHPLSGNLPWNGR